MFQEKRGQKPFFRQEEAHLNLVNLRGVLRPSVKLNSELPRSGYTYSSLSEQLDIREGSTVFAGGGRI